MPLICSVIQAGLRSGKMLAISPEQTGIQEQEQERSPDYTLPETPVVKKHKVIKKNTEEKMKV